MKTIPDALKKLYPYQEHRFEINGVAMNYVDEGPVDGPVVIMLHGNPSWSFLYRHLIEGLKDRMRVIVPDHIGCGLSDKPQDYPYTLRTHIDNVKALLQYLHINEADLIVHDWGGAIGMGVVTEEAFQPRHIVILNTAAFIMPQVPLRIRLCRAPGLGPLSVRGGNAFALGATYMATESPMSSEIRAGFVYPYDSWHNRIAVLRFVQDIPLSPADPTWELANRIHANLPKFSTTPIQIHWGAKDFCFDHQCLDIWKQVYPHALVHEYHNAGHYCLEDAHQEIVPRVRSFLCS